MTKYPRVRRSAKREEGSTKEARGPDTGAAKRPAGVGAASMVSSGMAVAAALLATAAWVNAATAAAPETHPPASADPAPAESRSAVAVSGDEVVLNTVRVNRRLRRVMADGWLNQREGLIELLACGLKGKTHESVFVLEVNPVDVQAALLLLGLRPGSGPECLGVGQPDGSSVDVWVEWEHGDRRHRMRAESLIEHTRRKAPLPKTPWVFTGSRRENGTWMATVEEGIVATFWDPWAILNLPLLEGADDEVLVPRAQVLPPLNTPVTLCLEVAAKADAAPSPDPSAPAVPHGP